jgi:hypothetical protein
MALNDQTLLVAWSRQHNNEDGNVWHWRIEFLPEHVIKAFEHVADTTNEDTAAWPTEWSDKATIACWKRTIETDGDNEWRQDKNTYPKVIAAAGHEKERMMPANDNHCHTSSASVGAFDSDPNEVQVSYLWGKEARKEDIYKISYCIFFWEEVLISFCDCHVGLVGDLHDGVTSGLLTLLR